MNTRLTCKYKLQMSTRHIHTSSLSSSWSLYSLSFKKMSVTNHVHKRDFMAQVSRKVMYLSSMCNNWVLNRVQLVRHATFDVCPSQDKFYWPLKSLLHLQESPRSWKIAYCFHWPFAWFKTVVYAGMLKWNGIFRQVSLAHKCRGFSRWHFSQGEMLLCAMDLCCENIWAAGGIALN